MPIRQAGPLQVSACPAGGRGSVSREQGGCAPFLGAALVVAGWLCHHSGGVGGQPFGQGRRMPGEGLLLPWIVRHRRPLDFLKRAGRRT